MELRVREVLGFRLLALGLGGVNVGYCPRKGTVYTRGNFTCCIELHLKDHASVAGERNIQAYADTRGYIGCWDSGFGISRFKEGHMPRLPEESKKWIS